MLDVGFKNVKRTIEEILQWAVRELATATDRPQLEAQVLLAHVLERPRTFVMAHHEAALAPEQEERFAAIIARRRQNEPLPYLTGRVEFFGLELTVTPAVLIPRPETELIVETALDWLRARPLATAVDVGAGSGCLAVTLAVHAPKARCYAIDISTEALAIARSNALRHKVDGRITFLEGDLLEPLPEPVDVIVSNPPYVADAEWNALPPSVKREPRLALTSGADGLDALRRLLAQAPQALHSGGLLLCEIGERQGAAVQALAQSAFPNANVQILPDLAGKPRTLRVDCAA
ncbi:MAG: peptide chain release factor N(5)-glutamine methyltransferase [Anaerolineae bacterium]|nr:peptide chain release factor N(5)-glutamine methyltransferase [Anaerolineae bacterium]